MPHVQHSQRKEETFHVDDRCKVVLSQKEDSEHFAQEEKGKLSHLYSPQDEYVATQNRTTDKPKEYFGEDNDLYLKQLVKFRENVESGKLNYFYTERAVQVQNIIEKIYCNK